MANTDQPGQSGVRICLDFHITDECKRTEESVNQMGKVTLQVVLLKGLVDINMRGSRKAYLGESVAKKMGDRFMYTLAADGRQFRCWYGLPGRVCLDHVDSMGEGILYQIVGDAELVRLYVDGVTTDFEGMKDSIGTTYYLPKPSAVRTCR